MYLHELDIQSYKNHFQNTETVNEMQNQIIHIWKLHY